jgi:uncharacterized protein YjbI with pentapeptide repeats
MGWRDWTGVGERRWKKAPDEEVQPGKTLWDWLQLLIVPAILIGVTFAWSTLQTRSENQREEGRIAADNSREDRRIAADRAAAEEARQDATLQGYFDQMSGLILHEKLLSSEWDDPVRAVARTVTLATVRRLDGERKAEVVRFLNEARLAETKDPHVFLKGADLTNANLRSAFLPDANLDGADLRGADLRGADLRSAELMGTDLRGTDLRSARLSGANLSGDPFAFVPGANLAGANLTGADLDGAYLPLANFKGATLRGVDFRKAVLRAESYGWAKLGEADLAGAKNLNLGRFLTDLPQEHQKPFLDSQKKFLDSLSPDELAEFNLTPAKLAKFRREASGG